jgi:hypothetical protein
MKTICSVFILSILFNYSFSQNLVPNGSFEDTVACPIGTGNITYSVGWSSYNHSPDYFNSCNNNQVGVPSNYFGYQYPSAGDAYAGLYTYARFGIDVREIIGIQLNQALIIGHRYYVSFYTSRAFNPIPGIRINIATNKLGARFSTLPYSVSSSIPIDNFADVYSDSVFSDTTGWTRISGYFIADSSYQYLSIGNFFDDSATTHITYDTTAAFAYYYIDDVLVIEDTTTSINSNSFSTASCVKIFPNPARDWIMVEGRDIKSFSVINALGNTCIEDASSNSSLLKIDVSELSRGIYFIKINTSKESLIRKIILTK